MRLLKATEMSETLTNRRFKVLPPGCIMPAYNKQRKPLKTIVMTKKPCLWDDKRKQVVAFWGNETIWDEYDLDVLADWLSYYERTFPPNENLKMRKSSTKWKDQAYHVSRAHKKVSRYGMWHIGAFWGSHLEQIWPPASIEAKKSRRQVLRELFDELVTFGTI